MESLIKLIQVFIQYGLAPTATFAAGYVGVKYGLKQLREEKKIDIIEQQLNKFYSPLLAYRKETQAKGQVRFKLKKAGDVVWERRGEHARQEDLKYVDKEIEYNNKQFENELLPLYYRMLDVFRDNYWLAEPETEKYYPILVEYVDMWKRWLEKSVDPEVARTMGADEEKLNQFYEELERRTQILRSKITK